MWGRVLILNAVINHLYNQVMYYLEMFRNSKLENKYSSKEDKICEAIHGTHTQKVCHLNSY